MKTDTEVRRGMELASEHAAGLHRDTPVLPWKRSYSGGEVAWLGGLVLVVDAAFEDWSEIGGSWHWRICARICENGCDYIGPTIVEREAADTVEDARRKCLQTALDWLEETTSAFESVAAGSPP